MASAAVLRQLRGCRESSRVKDRDEEGALDDVAHSAARFGILWFVWRILMLELPVGKTDRWSDRAVSQYSPHLTPRQLVTCNLVLSASTEEE